MKVKHFLLLALTGIALILAGAFIGRVNRPPGEAVVTETTETRVDTVTDEAPAPHSEIAMGTYRCTVPVYRFIGGAGGMARPCAAIDCDSAVALAEDKAVPMVGRDSAIVQLPMIQRYYGDSTYEAWVSGPVNPRLDSIRVFARTTTVTRREWKPPKRWHVGVTAGYGYGPKGLQPYVGVGITYSVFSF